MPLTGSTVAAIGQRTNDDPDFAAAVEAELQAMRSEQELVALRNASGLSQRQLAATLGVKQPVIAKLEAGKTRNIGLQTLVRAVKAMNGSIEVSITPKGHEPRADGPWSRRRENARLQLGKRSA